MSDRGFQMSHHEKKSGAAAGKAATGKTGGSKAGSTKAGSTKKTGPKGK